MRFSSADRHLVFIINLLYSVTLVRRAAHPRGILPPGNAISTQSLLRQPRKKTNQSIATTSTPTRSRRVVTAAPPGAPRVATRSRSIASDYQPPPLWPTGLQALEAQGLVDRERGIYISPDDNPNPDRHLRRRVQSPLRPRDAHNTPSSSPSSRRSSLSSDPERPLSAEDDIDNLTHALANFTVTRPFNMGDVPPGNNTNNPPSGGGGVNPPLGAFNQAQLNQLQQIVTNAGLSPTCGILAVTCVRRSLVFITMME